MFALFGESDVIAGTGLFTVNGEVADVPPPGAGLVTVTLNVPAAAMSAAVIAAVTCVALTNVVVFAVPLKFTTDDELKIRAVHSQRECRPARQSRWSAKAS